MGYEIVEFRENDRDQVINLWRICELTRSWNDPGRDIDRNQADPAGKIFLLKKDGLIVGSVMVGYDGHRGWVYYLSVHPDHRNRNLGRILMTHSEDYLKALGCPKLNLMVRSSNRLVMEFYERLDYLRDDVTVMSKRLTSDPRS